jgi:hypothetical protein
VRSSPSQAGRRLANGKSSIPVTSVALPVRLLLDSVHFTPSIVTSPNQSGYVTLTMAPRATLPLKRGYHVQFFLRTRKEGDSLLAGVSSRRLAQVATR